MSNKEKIIVTGSAGFIGFHLCKLLLNKGYEVIGLDSLTDYYDINLKSERLNILSNLGNFKDIRLDITKFDLLEKIFIDICPKYVFHLAAQAGVRYSIENPKTYLESNIIGTFNILEMIKKYPPKHTLIASTSSVYGSNKNMPFTEDQKTDTQISFYAATKKSCEILSHSYSHIHQIPITNFRFFTVYGPWGRPDMALFKFVEAIKTDKPIDVYNNGNMKRDFTYIDDLVQSIFLLMKCVPNINKRMGDFDSLSPVAPWRAINIGNSEVEELKDFIEVIENNLGKKAIKNFLPMQLGDVKATYADNNLLFKLTKFRPKTKIDEGIKKFVEWYEYYYENKI